MSKSGIQQAYFADGTVWNLSALSAAGFAVGSEAGTAIRGTVAADTIRAGAGNDNVYGGTDNDILYGEAGDDLLYGEAGDDTLEGGAGADTLTGGLGNNTYRFGRGDGADRIVASSNDVSTRLNTLEFKTGVTAADIIGSRNVNDLVLAIAGTADQITLTDFFAYDSAGTYLTNPVQQARFADGTEWDFATLASSAFSIGSAAGTTIRGTVIGDSIHAGAGNDNVYGGTGNDTLYGEGDNDLLYGEAGDDTLEGGAGTDTLIGGTGNNTYRFGRGDGQDLITINSDSTANRINTVEFKDGVAVSDIVGSRNVNDLVLAIAGTTDRITLTSFFDYDAAGTYLTNPVQQARFADGTVWNLSALSNAGFAVGSASATTIRGTSSGDTIRAGAGNDNVYGGTGNDTLYGEAGDDNLYGEAGDDTLEGGAGTDTLTGGLGNNTYRFGRGDGADRIVASSNDVSTRLNTLEFKTGVVPADIIGSRNVNDLVLAIAGTTDQITLSDFFAYDSAGTYLTNPVQQAYFADGTVWNLSALSNAAFGTGSAVGTTVRGTTVNDTIRAGAGNDTVEGLTGNDMLYGEDGNDTLKGSDGDDVLDGGAGTDTLTGGTGNNTYRFGRGDGADRIVASSNDVSTRLNTLEFKTGVTVADIIGSRNVNDLVLAIAGTTDQITLSDFYAYDSAGTYLTNPVQQARFADGTVWNLSALSNAGFAVGSAAGTAIRGTVADDTIRAGAGNDNVSGLTGNDILFGEAGDDLIYGNAGDDTLDGGAGIDTLTGGAGNDSYVIDHASDTITENFNEGTDTVKSTLTYTLATNLENLTLLGTSAINGTGNTVANLLIGNSAANTLTGNAGNDSLDGGAGTDSLVGGTGNDTYQFGLGYGTDTITENDATVGNTDVARFMSGIATDQIWLRHVGNNLELSIIGTSDKLTIQNWYTGSAYHVEQFQTADNKQLLDTRVENLVQAMASFAPPAAGQTTLPQNYQDVLASVIAANWQ